LQFTEYSKLVDFISTTSTAAINQARERERERGDNIKIQFSSRSKETEKKESDGNLNNW